MMLSLHDNMMMLGGTYYSPKPKVAETFLLDWDGSNTTLQFFVNLQDTSASSSCPTTAPKVTVSWSPDRITWQPLWNSSGKWVDTNQWIGVRVPLPLSAAAAPRFAVKWVNTDPGSAYHIPGSNPCTVAYIDDITFPARPPTAANMGLGKPPGRLPADSEECSPCLHQCRLLLSGLVFNKAVQDALGRAGLSP